MASESWASTTLGDEVDILAGFPFRSSEYSEDGSGIPLVRGDNVVQGRFRWEGVKRWPASKLDGLQDYLLQAGDVILAMDRPWIEAGLKFARVSELDLPCLLVQRVARLRAGETLDQHYLRYVIASNEFTSYILGVQTGTAVPHISSGQVKEFRFLRPPIPTQRAIAALLGALDDKIELNRRLNATLEALARAIFQSWFVDFDPVRAKMERRQPVGMDAATAALFPDAFEDSALGETPKGWSVGPIAELARIGRDGIDPSAYPVEVFDHYSFPAYDEGRVPHEETGDSIKSNKYLVPRGAVLLSKLNPHIPRVWLPTIRSERRSICSTEFLVMLPQPGSTREYLYGLFSSPSFLDVFAMLVTGTSNSHQRVKPEYLLAMETILPSKSVVARYSETVAPLHDRIAANLRESRTLVALRDALLPKLLSGEVRVREADRLVGAVT
ncbi:MAG TPA: restriction endonuclease subunit S [Thermomicrobiales bacterium]|nr:restriction endonuclease subunit S [Thermomicrobiales bacterium]